jgi:anti-anti-sigma factor
LNTELDGKEQEVRISKDQSGRVLQISGTLDIREADELLTALRDFVHGETQPVIDLSGVESCDTVAFQLLCSARKTAADMGKPLQLLALPAPVQDAAAALGLRL